MVSIKCPECGNQISDEAPFCIFCNCSIRNKESGLALVPNSYKVCLPSFEPGSPQKLKAIKVVREIYDMGLTEAREFVEQPKACFNKLNQNQAAWLAKRFQAEGVEITVCDSSGLGIFLSPAVKDNKESAEISDLNDNKQTSDDNLSVKSQKSEETLLTLKVIISFLFTYGFVTFIFGAMIGFDYQALGLDFWLLAFPLLSFFLDLALFLLWKLFTSAPTEKYIEQNKEPPACPRCKSKVHHTGTLNNGKPVLTCLKCGHHWEP